MWSFLIWGAIARDSTKIQVPATTVNFPQFGVALDFNARPIASDFKMDILIGLVESSYVTLNIHDAKTRFSKLIEAVTQGEPVIIARAGKPVAALISFDLQLQVRKPGALKGKMGIAEDFDMPLPENISASVEGN